MSNVHFSSQSDEWETPQDTFDALNLRYSFTLDPCATPNNAKCAKFFTMDDNGLAQDWGRERVFVNPPYGRAIGKWVYKSFMSAQEGALVVMLIPARTDTTYWHDYIMRADEIWFIKGRLKFGGNQNSAPFPSAIIVFKPNSHEGLTVFSCDATGGELSAK